MLETSESKLLTKLQKKLSTISAEELQDGFDSTQPLLELGKAYQTWDCERNPSKARQFLDAKSFLEYRRMPVTHKESDKLRLSCRLYRLKETFQNPGITALMGLHRWNVQHFSYKELDAFIILLSSQKDILENVKQRIQTLLVNGEGVQSQSYSALC